MENVSKALTIAGGMMIAIMVVGLLIFGYQRISSLKNTQDEATKTSQLAEFNSQLEAYNKQVVPGYQLISLANLAKDLNDKNESNNEGYDAIRIEVRMQVTLSGPYSNIGGVKQKNLDKFVEFISTTYQNLSPDDDEGFRKKFKELYFKCTEVGANQTNGRINYMKFEELEKK